MIKLTRPLVVLDLETTGTWVERDKIVEIGMVKLLPDGKEETFVQRVNPGMPIPAEVIEIIHITDEDVKNAPAFKEIAPKVLSFLDKCDLGGFSADIFDIPLLKREFCEAGLDWNLTDVKIVDAKMIYHLNEKRDLTSAYKFYCKKELTNAHSALADAAATMEVLKEQVKMYGDEAQGLESMNKFVYKKKSEFVDGKLRIWNGDYYLTFGKYRNKCLKELEKTDKAYLAWLLTTDLTETVKGHILQAMNPKVTYKTV